MNAFVHNRNENSLSAFLAVCLGAWTLGLVGCGSTTVQMPATELAKISSPGYERTRDWPTVRTVDGEETQMIGEIKSIHVDTDLGPQPVHRPFVMQIDGPVLSISDPLGSRTIPLPMNPKATVQYENAKLNRQVKGGVMTGLSVPVLGLGMIGIFVGAKVASNSGSDGLGRFVGGTIILLGAAGAAGGLGLAIPGIYMLATKPPKPKSRVALHNPQFRMGPAGASFSAAF